MAKGTAKNNHKTNTQRLNMFWMITLGVNVLYLVYIYFTSDEFISFGTFGSFAFWAGQEIGMMKLLMIHGQPKYDESGNIDTCVDLSDTKQLALYSYAQDVLWLCWGLQVLSMISSWFSYLWAGIPIFAAVKLWSSVVSPLLAMRAVSQQPQQPEAPEPELDARARLQKRREEARRGGKK